MPGFTTAPENQANPYNWTLPARSSLGGHWNLGPRECRYILRQNFGTNRTRIEKISSRPIIISTTNNSLARSVKWP